MDSSDAVAALALLVSLGSLYVSWRQHRRSIKAERPIFWIDRPFNSASEGDWHHISIRVRNRMQHSLRCEEVTILKPRRGIIAPVSEATAFVQGKGTRLKPGAAPENWTRIAAMRLAATHSGQETLPIRLGFKYHGAGETDDEDFLVHCAPRFRSAAWLSRRPIKLSMRITWRSKDESSRRQTSDVHTELMPAIAIAKQAT